MKLNVKLLLEYRLNCEDSTNTVREFNTSGIRASNNHIYYIHVYIYIYVLGMDGLVASGNY